MRWALREVDFFENIRMSHEVSDRGFIAESI
jgi:hypothetical protein